MSSKGYKVIVYEFAKNKTQSENMSLHKRKELIELYSFIFYLIKNNEKLCVALTIYQMNA